MTNWFLTILAIIYCLPSVIGVQTSYTSKISKELSSWNKFKNKVEISAILTKSVHFHLCKLWKQKGIKNQPYFIIFLSCKGANSSQIFYYSMKKTRYFITINGWLRFDKMVFSLMIWSTCLSLMISAFLSTFRATYELVFLRFDSFTLPKDPKRTDKHLFNKMLSSCVYPTKLLANTCSKCLKDFIIR